MFLINKTPGHWRHRHPWTPEREALDTEGGDPWTLEEETGGASSVQPFLPLQCPSVSPPLVSRGLLLQCPGPPSLVSRGGGVSSVQGSYLSGTKMLPQG